jgi:hypothetical protein
MKKLKIIGFSFLGIILIAVGFFSIRYALNPLRHSEARIRERILNQTPIGSTIDDVIRVILGGIHLGNGAEVLRIWGIQLMREQLPLLELNP